MNENLNLVEILKDCPKGTKLYSTVFGDVELDHIDIRANYPIVIRIKDSDVIECLTTEGMLFTEYEGECILFPSRDQRDWSKFKLKRCAPAPIREFKDGDIVATNSRLQVFILAREKNDEEGSCYIGYNSGLNNIFFGGEFKFVRFATEEEKQKLFDAIKERGYKWNAETKTLEKLVKSKFDPKTLKPFDKVLVRDFAGTEWFCDLFSYIENIKSQEESFICTGGISFNFCIPYNDKTKYLVGTTKEAPKYYRYWEDRL